MTPAGSSSPAGATGANALVEVGGESHSTDGNTTPKEGEAKE